MKLPLTFDRTVKLGDLLTCLTIAIAFAALLATVSRERDAKTLEMANRVRSAAALAITKLDRWQALHASVYQELQPSFVELSELLRERYDVELVRDQFWKRVNGERAKAAQKALDEQLGTAYAELLANFPAARDKFMSVNQKLAETESAVTDSFLAKGEQGILSLRDRQKSYVTATLGNMLRDIADAHKAELRKRSEIHIKPTRDYLFEVILRSDKEIVGVSRSMSSQ